MNSVNRWLARFDRRDVLLLMGFAALVYGVSRVYEPAAWITAGALMLTGWLGPFLRKGQ